MVSKNVKALLVLTLLLAASTAMGFPKGPPSYSCDVQLNRVEQMICDSEELSYIDRNFSVIYRYSVERWPVQDGVDIKEAQREWLRRRNRCETIECVGKMYLERTPVLKPANLRNYGGETYTYWARARFWNEYTDKTWTEFEYLIGPYERPEIKQDFEFVHGGGPEYPICQEFIEMLNAHEDKEELICGLPDFEGHPKFSSPPLRELSLEEVIDLYGEQAALNMKDKGTAFYMGHWDLNHDGIQDKVLKMDYVSGHCLIGNGSRKPYSSIFGWPVVGSSYATEEYRRLLGEGRLNNAVASVTNIIGGSYEDKYYGSEGVGRLFMYEGRGYVYNGRSLAQFLRGTLPASDRAANVEIRDFKRKTTSTVCLIEFKES